MRANKTAASYNISIHAPRTGSDSAAPTTYKAPSTFQSTLPARGATRVILRLPNGEVFQSTLPARGATSDSNPNGWELVISIHAPRTGSD